MALTLDDLKKQFADSDNKSTFNNADWYRFWNMDFDQVVTFRFLPDGDPKASHFLVEKWLHRLEVNIDGMSPLWDFLRPPLQLYGQHIWRVGVRAGTSQGDPKADVPKG